VLTAVRGETASHPLCRAPLTTHGNGRALCRAPRGKAHGKEWSRRKVDPGRCRAPCYVAHGNDWSRRTVDGYLCRAPRGQTHGKGWSRHPVHHTLCRASYGLAHGKEWSMCRAPPQAHDKGTILAAFFGQFAVRLSHDARQIDQNFLFFSVFHVQKFPKTIYMTYIS
jgi:hypothetical protein